MHIKIQIIINDDDEQSEIIEDVVHLEKQPTEHNNIGLSLQESKLLLQTIQKKIVLRQAEYYIKSHRCCSECFKKRRIKSYHPIQYRTLFGVVVIPSVRLYHCDCEEKKAKSFSPLTHWLPEHSSPELRYIETKWASHMSYGLTANLLKDVLPVSPTQNAATVRNHLHHTAQRLELDLKDKPDHILGCPRDWGNLPKPDKPITVGIDGGYVRNWECKNKNFEVIVGKSFSATKKPKRFGLIQSMDDNPRRRLMNVLNEQGMQANQQITFLSDGADNVRDLQYLMYPESEHVLDWFHITMRITVLQQFAKGLIKSDPDAGSTVQKELESTKWYLWHGNVEKARESIDECYIICIDEAICYENRKKLIKHLEEMDTYILNNQHLIPNYGEKWRYGEAISTGFVESTVNEVVAKRMVKKQQMQWTQKGAHYLLQIRTSVLNNDLKGRFEHWYPGLKLSNAKDRQLTDVKKAA